MAFARHNVEKHRLIEMVRQNPILWDCRLPHYKRSDKKKDIKWCELGRTFNVSGERVQRTFTSLREIFRRELNHEKLLGDRFTSKWEYYDAMSFLKDVIRERKIRCNTRSQGRGEITVPCDVPLLPNLRTKDSYSRTRDRFRPELNSMSKEMMDEYAYYTPHQTRNCLNLQPDVIINDSPSPPPQPVENSSSPSSTPSVSIKEEQTDHDGDDEGNGESSRIRNRRKIPQAIPNQSSHTGSPGPAASTSSNQRHFAKNPTTSHNCARNNPHEEDDTTTAIRQTPREILYTKFGEFLSARLNTLNETVANDLMNRILLLIAEN